MTHVVTLKSSLLQGAAPGLNSAQVCFNLYGISWLANPLFMIHPFWLQSNIWSNSHFPGWQAARLLSSSLVEYIIMANSFPGWPATKILSWAEFRAGRSVRPPVASASQSSAALFSRKVANLVAYSRLKA
jgi:hypothetical protein